MALQGNIELASRYRLVGWAWDPDDGDAPISLVVEADGQVLARCLANGYRDDLKSASIGNGRHAFDIAFDPPVSLPGRGRINVRRETDGAQVPGSPAPIDQDADDELEDQLAALSLQANRLRRLHAERQSGEALRQRHRRFASGDLNGLPSQGWHSVARQAPRALIIDDIVPDPRRDAGSNAILSHMRSLQRLGFEVSFLPAAMHGDGARLEAENIACGLHPLYGSVEEVISRQRDAFAVVYLHRISNASRYAALARFYQPRTRLIYSLADLHSLRLSRQAEVELRPDLKVASQSTWMLELAAAWYADAVLTHSTVEAAILQRHVPAEKVHVVPWAVEPRPVTVPFEQRRGLAFIGGYTHHPNVDAANHLIDTIMPAIWARDPDIPCWLVGKDMPDSLKQRASDRVKPIGFVDDLAAIFNRVRLTVAPLAWGAGIKGKVLESLAAGVPCVCTPNAAEGLDLPDVLLAQVASGPDAFARTVLDLHTDPRANEASGRAGLAFIERFASAACVDAGLARAVGKTLPAPPRSQASA